MVGRCDEVVDIRKRRVLLAGRSVVVGIGRADVGPIAPRQREQDATIRWMKEHYGMLHGEPIPLHHDVNAFGRTQHLCPARTTHRQDFVGPRPRRIDDRLSLHLAKTSIAHAPDDHAGNTTLFALGEGIDPSPVDRDRSILDRVDHRLQGQACVVRRAVVIDRRALEPLLLQQRLVLGHLAWLESLVPLRRTEQSQPVVEPHAGIDHPEALARTLVHRKQKRERVDQMRREVLNDAPLAHRLEHQAELVALEVAKTAVDQLARS